MKYAVIIEAGPNNYSAYVPDLPGCIATGATRKEVERRIRDAIAMHVGELRREKQRVPKPSAWADVVEVPA